jgi:hypothetical protein
MLANGYRLPSWFLNNLRIVEFLNWLLDEQVTPHPHVQFLEGV